MARAARPTLILPSNGRAHGWRPDTPNVNARRLHQRLSTRTRVTALPDPMIDPKLYPLIRDQDWLGSCTGFGTENAMIIKFKERHPHLFGKGKWSDDYRFSPLALYWLGRRRENSILVDSGCEIQDVVGEAMAFGAPTEESWPYYIESHNWKRKPVQKAFDTGLWHQALGSWRADEKGASTEKTVDNMLRGLHAGLTGVYGFTCYDNLSEADDTGVVPLPRSNSRVEGGHCVTFLWADTRARIFWGANSWSNKWGGRAPKGARYDERGYIGLPFQGVIDGWIDDAWLIDVEQGADQMRAAA